MKKVLLILLCLSPMTLAAYSPFPVMSGEEADGLSFSLSPYVSLAYGYSDELVFGEESGSYPYLSKLHWEIEPALIAGLAGSLSYNKTFSFNFSAGSTLNAKTGQMQDYDWISTYFSVVETEWTHFSESDIYLKENLLFDANASYRIVGRKSFSADLLVGYKYIKWFWIDSLLEIDYPYEGNYDSLIGESGIEYEVVYKIPYFGFALEKRISAFALGVGLRYSPVVYASDHDFHKLRGLHFYDSFSQGQYWGLSLYQRWQWHPSFLLSLSWDGDYVSETRGDVLVYNDYGEYLGTYEEGAGVKYLSGALSLSLNYSY